MTTKNPDAMKQDVSKVSAFGYTPTVDTLAAVRANIKTAASSLATMAVQMEESKLSNLIVAVADYYSLYFCQNGQWPKSENVRDFVFDTMGGKDNATSSYRTLDNHLTIANKAAALVSQGKRTGVFVAWWRVEGTRQEVNRNVAAPAGKGWVRLLMLNKAIYAPDISKTIKGRETRNARPSVDEPGSRAEIELAYSILIANKSSNGAGKLDAKKRPDAPQAGQGKVTTPAETLASIASDLKDTTNLLALIGAMTNAIKASKVRSVIAGSDALRTAVVDLYAMLDTHIDADGEFSVAKVDKSGDTILETKAA